MGILEREDVRLRRKECSEGYNDNGEGSSPLESVESVTANY